MLASGARCAVTGVVRQSVHKMEVQAQNGLCALLRQSKDVLREDTVAEVQS